MRIPRFLSSMNRSWMRPRPAAFFAPMLCLLAFGCASDPAARQNLQAGEKAFTSNQYDQAIRYADVVLADQSSDVTPEAHYLRGLAVEERQKQDNAAAQHDLQSAAADYNAALSMHPTKLLEGMARMQLGNAMFRLDRYAEALQQWSVADGLLVRDDLKMWDEYYMGICLQRLGRFTDADTVFQRVINTYPKTEPAKRARLRQGLRGFYVQIGAFTEAADAEKAASAILAVGGVPMKTMNNNMTVIRTGGMASYAQAMGVKSRLAGQYPDAAVVP